MPNTITNSANLLTASADNTSGAITPQVLRNIIVSSYNRVDDTLSNGSIWRVGSGTPNNSTGANGDYYLNSANGDVYLRSTGTYNVVANITGPQGQTGPTGQLGQRGATWTQGSSVPSGGANGDFYFRTTTDDVFFNTTGTWGIIANLKGGSGSGSSSIDTSTTTSISTFIRGDGTNIQGSTLSQDSSGNLSTTGSLSVGSGGVVAGVNNGNGQMRLKIDGSHGNGYAVAEYDRGSISQSAAFVYQTANTNNWFVGMIENSNNFTFYSYTANAVVASIDTTGNFHANGDISAAGNVNALGGLVVSGGASFTSMPYGTCHVGNVNFNSGVWAGSGFAISNSTGGSNIFSCVCNADSAYFGFLHTNGSATPVMIISSSSVSVSQPISLTDITVSGTIISSRDISTTGAVNANVSNVNVTNTNTIQLNPTGIPGNPNTFFVDNSDGQLKFVDATNNVKRVAFVS